MNVGRRVTAEPSRMICPVVTRMRVCVDPICLSVTLSWQKGSVTGSGGSFHRRLQSPWRLHHVPHTSLFSSPVLLRLRPYPMLVHITRINSIVLVARNAI